MPRRRPTRSNGHDLTSHDHTRVRLANVGTAGWLDTTGPFQRPGTDPARAREHDSAGEQIYYPPSGTDHRPVAPPLPPPRNGYPGPALIPADTLAQDHSPTVMPTHPPTAEEPVPLAAPITHREDIDAGEAAALAGFFAADALSWNEDDSERWYEVLGRYLPGVDVRRLGWWNGTGRQRVDLALPGRVTRADSDHVAVEVRVRITPYTRNPRAPLSVNTSAPEPPVPDSVTATAPPPAAAGWRGHDAYATRLLVPITRTGPGTLIIDTRSFAAAGSADSDGSETHP